MSSLGIYMPKFLVRTDERVSGAYMVDAKDGGEAFDKVDDQRMREDTEQIDYQAYCVEVTDVEEIHVYDS